MQPWMLIPYISISANTCNPNFPPSLLILLHSLHLSLDKSTQTLHSPFEARTTTTDLRVEVCQHQKMMSYMTPGCPKHQFEDPDRQVAEQSTQHISESEDPGPAL